VEYATSPFQIKTLTDEGAVEGWLTGFGDVDLGGDRLLAGCLAKSLASRSTPIPMLFAHDLSKPIGAWKEWREERSGLFGRGKLTLEVAAAREAHALARDGGLSGISIGWMPKQATVDREGTRVVSEAELFEASLVPVPMHPRALVTAVKGFNTARDIADLLQSSGLSGRKARAAAGAAWKAINEQSDEATVDAELARIVANSVARLAKGGREHGT